MGCWQSSVLDSDSETGLPHTQQITDDNFVGHLRPHAYTNQCRYGKFAMIARRTVGTSPQVQSAAHRTQLSVCCRAMSAWADKERTTRERTAEGVPALWANCGGAE